VLLGNTLGCNRIRQEEEKVIQYIYSNKIRQEQGQATEAERNTRGCLAKEKKGEKRRTKGERERERERESFNFFSKKGYVNTKL
jgi:hypothetical protein